MWWQENQHIEHWLSGKESPKSKTGSLVSNISRTDSRRVSNNCSFSKKCVCRKYPKHEIGRKTSSFLQELEKDEPKSGHFIYSKRARDTILENSSTKDYSKIKVTVSKTQEIDQAIMEILGKVEYYIPDYFLNNILLVKMKHWGNCPHINLKALNKLIA